MTMFKKRISVKEVEEGKNLSPKFDERGLIPVITTDFNNQGSLMTGGEGYHCEAIKQQGLLPRSHPIACNALLSACENANEIEKA